MGVSVIVRCGATGDPISGIVVSDGTDVVVTDPRGVAELPGDSDLAFVRRGGGWTARTWWRRVEASGVRFDMIRQSEPETFRFAQITDLHLCEARISASGRPRSYETAAQERAAMADLAAPHEIEQLLCDLVEGAQVDFIVATGDLTDRSTPAELSGFAGLVDSCQVAVECLPGNHDLVGSDGSMARLDGAEYQRWLGPRWYSFDVGVVHFVALDSSQWRWGRDAAVQRNWLDRDLELVGDRPIVVLTHDQLDEDLYGRFPTAPIATFSGHWHTSRVVRDQRGTLHVNSGPPDMGGLDWTPPHVRIATWNGVTLDLETRARSGSDATSPVPTWFGFRAGSDSPPSSAAALEWSHRLLGTPFRSAPQIRDGAVIVASRDDDVACGWIDSIDTGSGVLRWRTELPEPIRASPEVAGEWVIAVTVAGRVVVVSLEDGSLRWQHRPESLLRQWCVLRPVSDGCIVAAGDVSSYRGYDLEDGSLVWERTDLGKHINHVAYAQPVVVDHAVVVGFWPQGPGLQAIELADGRVRWPAAEDRRRMIESRWGEHLDRAASSGLEADPSGDSLYAVFSDGSCHRLEIGDGRSRWRSEIGGLFHGTDPVVAVDGVYVVGHGRGVWKLDRRDGATLWRTRWEAPANPALAPYWRQGRDLAVTVSLAGDEILVPLTSGNLLRFDAQTGQRRGQIHTGVSLTSPVAVTPSQFIVAGVDGSIRSFVRAELDAESATR